MANIPWPDEIAKQNADVFSSYLAPLSEEKKIDIKREHKR